MRYAIAYLATAVVFLVADMIWLGVVAKNFYRSHLENFLLDQPSIPVAAGFYGLYVVGVIVFAVAPALREETWVTAAIYGALFGFFAYATYDLTNLATLKDWPAIVSIVDLIWGTCVTAVAAIGGYSITQQLS
jgi:uncharacterized membrane protein